MLSYCHDFARVMLESSGEFCPFGATLSPEGKVVAVGGHIGEEKPAAGDLYKFFLSSFAESARKNEIAGAALAANVNIPEEFESPSRDGVRVHLEALGYSRFVYIPYRITRRGIFRKTIEAEFFEPFAVEIAPLLFGPVGNDA